MVDVPEKYWNRLTCIGPIIEYSFEFPFGEAAIVWLKSQRAFYRVTSVDPLYATLWEPLIEAATLAGHVINTLLNIAFQHSFKFIIGEIAKVAKQTPEQIIEGIKMHREFVLREIQGQGVRRLHRFIFVQRLQSEASFQKYLFFSNVRSQIDFDNIGSSTRNKGKKAKYDQSLSSSSSSSSSWHHSLKKHDLPKTFAGKTLSKYKKKPFNAVAPTLEDQEQMYKAKDEISSENSSDLIDSDKDPPSRVVAIDESLSLRPRPKTKSSIVLPMAQDFNSPMGRRTPAVAYAPPHLKFLSLPSLEDEQFSCPFCGLLFYRKTKLTAVAQLAKHIASFHLDSTKKESFVHTKSPMEIAQIFSWPQRENNNNTFDDQANDENNLFTLHNCMIPSEGISSREAIKLTKPVEDHDFSDLLAPSTPSRNMLSSSSQNTKKMTVKFLNKPDPQNS